MIFLCTSTAIYSVNPSTWALTELVTGLSAGGIWDLADFGQYAVFVNNSAMAYSEGTAATTAALSTSSILPRVSTMCNLKGQAVGGNVKTTWHGCGTNSLIWSQIGALDFLPTKLNTAGFRDIPWPGDVLRVKRLGASVAVYGEQGIGLLVPVGDPAPTFGFKEVLNVGIAAKGAIGGDEFTHVFVDEEGWLWIWQDGQSPKRLGYQEFFSAMTADNMMISVDPSEREFYISDGSTSYLLTPYGLCETYQSLTSVFRSGNTTYGPKADGSDESFTVTTDTMDFGVRGFKTLSQVELGVDTGEVDQDVSVSIYGRSNKKSALGQSSWFRTNPEGVATPMRTAHEFRISVKADAYGSMKLDYIKSHIKIVDRRALRGVYTTPGARRA